MPNADGLTKIGDDTLVKPIWDMGDAYLEASTFVRMRTTIPIPHTAEDQRRRRLHPCGGGLHPGRAAGSRLAIAVSLRSKLRVALILCGYIRQLRQINSSVPGPVTGSPQMCDGYMFGDKPCGPFPDYAPLSAFYNRKLDIAKGITYPDSHGNTIRCARPDAEPFDDSRPLILTHGDLRMHIIIFGRDGRLWLVGWHWLGFFPPCFEYFSIVYAASFAPESWNRLIPFIANPLFKHKMWMGQLGTALVAYR
jgi:hypothetical protein